MINLTIGTVLLCTTPWITIPNHGAIQIKNTKTIVKHNVKMSPYHKVLKFDIKIDEGIRGYKFPMMLQKIGELHNTSIERVLQYDWIKLNCKNT